MNKSELIEAVAQKASLSKKDTDACLSALVSVVTDALNKGDKVQWTGFGALSFGKEQQEKALIRLQVRRSIYLHPVRRPSSPVKAFMDAFGK